MALTMAAMVLKPVMYFAGTLRDAEDDRRVHLLCGEQDALGPLQIVDVELADCVVAIARFQQHIGSIYQH